MGLYGLIHTLALVGKNLSDTLVSDIVNTYCSTKRNWNGSKTCYICIKSNLSNIFLIAIILVPMTCCVYFVWH